MGAWNFGDEAMGAEQMQETRDVGSATALLSSAVKPRWEQRRLEIPIAETVDMMFPTQHGTEQLLLGHAQQIQTAPPARTQPRGLVHAVEELQAGLRPVHDRQGAEVTFVGRDQRLVYVRGSLLQPRQQRIVGGELIDAPASVSAFAQMGSDPDQLRLGELPQGQGTQLFGGRMGQRGIRHHKLILAHGAIHRDHAPLIRTEIGWKTLHACVALGKPNRLVNR
jgi:hypothetical protein